MGFLAGFALLLAILGIYGTSSYSVVQRTPEIGVRIALGASPIRIRLMLLRQSMLPLLAGLIAGGGGAMALGTSFEHLISTTPQLGIASYAPASAALAIAAGSAVWVATRRILHLNPAQALRAE